VDADGRGYMVMLERMDRGLGAKIAKGPNRVGIPLTKLKLFISGWGSPWPTA